MPNVKFDYLLCQLRTVDITPAEVSQILNRITNLENNEIQVYYHELISTTSGSITPPLNSIVQSDKFGESGNAILSQINANLLPIDSPPTQADGSVVTATLDILTNLYVTSGVYTQPQVAIIYAFTILSKDWANVDMSKVLGYEELDYTNIEVKQKYEANPDTNALTDTLLSRLNTAFNWVNSNGATVLANIGTLFSDKADKAIDLVAGNGLSGGGNLSANRTFNVKTSKSLNIVSDNLELTNDQAAPTKNKYYGTDKEATKGFIDIPTTIIHNAGRFHMNTNERWVTESDDLYGDGLENFNENCGTGATPIVEWEHMGVFIKKGRTIKGLNLTGRLNSLAGGPTDIRIYLVVKTPTPITRWVTGFDADAEVTVDVIHDDLFMNPVSGTTFTGAFNDMHARIIDLDYEILEDCYLSLYVEPQGPVTTKRYFYTSYNYEIQ